MLWFLPWRSRPPNDPTKKIHIIWDNYVNKALLLLQWSITVLFCPLICWFSRLHSDFLIFFFLRWHPLKNWNLSIWLTMGWESFRFAYSLVWFNFFSNPMIQENYDIKHCKSLIFWQEANRWICKAFFFSAFDAQIQTGDSKFGTNFLLAWGSNWEYLGFPVIKITVICQVFMSPAFTVVWAWRKMPHDV